MKPAVFLIAFGLPAALQAQGARHSLVPAAAQHGQPTYAFSDSAAGHGELTLAFGGAMGAVSGLVAGGFIGARLEMAGGCEGDEWCGFGGALLGAAIGSTIMIPAAVHLANDQRGSFTSGLAVSAAALGGGIVISLFMHDAHPVLLIPVAQIIGAVSAERRTSRVNDSGTPLSNPEFQ
jgi:hypothetical protein